jgi:biopolymer transport protein ExbD
VSAAFRSLESFFRSERDKDPQPEIHLRPDRRSRYETTALVMAAAQRNRMKKMGFVNNGDFRE